MHSQHPEFETIQVNSLEVVCDGGQGALGHPRVYLHIEGQDGFVVCPYCSRTFLYAGGDHSHAA